MGVTSMAIVAGGVRLRRAPSPPNGDRCLYDHPGECRGPVAGRSWRAMPRFTIDRCTWAPAFAGVGRSPRWGSRRGGRLPGRGCLRRAGRTLPTSVILHSSILRIHPGEGRGPVARRLWPRDALSSYPPLPLGPGLRRGGCGSEGAGYVGETGDWGEIRGVTGIAGNGGATRCTRSMPRGGHSITRYRPPPNKAGCPRGRSWLLCGGSTR